MTLPAGKPHQLRMKILVIAESGNSTDELQVDVATRALSSMQVPFDVFVFQPSGNLTYPYLTGTYCIHGGSHDITLPANCSFCSAFAND